MSASGSDHDKDFDAIVIGTGFGGAVTAARLVQAGLRVCVLERGRKYEGNDFPMYPDAEALLSMDGGVKPAGAAPDLARWLWSIDQGIYDVRDLDDVVSVQAAGYGGGSLIYANVHLRTPDDVFQQGWPEEYRRENLDPYYDRVAYMLDVRPVPPGQKLRKAEQLKGLAKSKHIGGLVHAIDPPLAVTFATGEHAAGLTDEERSELKKRREKERPWTKGQRQRGACDMRGQCWLGCRQGAKNSLDFNYLRIIETAENAHIHLGAEATKIKRLNDDKDGARYAVEYQDLLTTPDGDKRRDAPKESYKARYVFLAGGAINTTELLLRSKTALKGDDDPWPGLGKRYYPNADSLAAVFDTREPQDADRGPTITSALLHQKPRKADNGFLWAIDFRLTESWHETYEGTRAEAARAIELALQPGAEIRIDTKNSVNVKLAEPPIFDVGGFASPSSVAMLVVDGGQDVARAQGEIKVRWNDGDCSPFGKILGKPRKLEDWFLIEDGGYPTDIEPLLGILRSPLWLRRNRFIERFDDEKLVQAGPLPTSGDSGPLRFPVATAMEALFGVPRRSTRVSTGLDDVADGSSDALAALPLDISLKEMLPTWFREALAEDRTDIAKALAPLVGQMLEAVLDDVAKRLVGRFDALALAGGFTGSVAANVGDIPNDQREDLVRGLLRQSIQLLWGSEVALAARVNEMLMDKIPGDLYALADALAPLAGWLLNYREGNGRTALLLTMGRDQYRGQLRLDETHDRLTAFLPKPLTPTSRLAQEQVLRAIAATWEGELRTNPAWTALNRRITVHSQGGCPMCACGGWKQKGKAKTDCACMAVTRPDGEVIGCEGLYVMDAAAFPTAVGVNPSATIAAVAEYKVERIIDNVLLTDSDVDKSKRDKWKKRLPDDHDVNDWIAELKHDHGEHVLDPLAPIGDEDAADKALEPLGMSFKESMSGLVSEVHDESGVDWDKLTGLEEEKASFEQAERAGLEENKLLRLELTATIGDLECFFRSQRRGIAMRLGVEGEIKLGGERYSVDPTKSYVQMFRRPPPSDAGNRDRRRFFRYHIVFPDKKTLFWIDAAKVASDDPRFDVWQDFTTLYFEWFEGEPVEGKRPPPSKRGIFRMAPADFFETQLQSMTITPEKADPARKSWAYAGFVRYFTDELATVYIERRGLIKAMARNLLDPSRGG